MTGVVVSMNEKLLQMARESGGFVSGDEYRVRITSFNNESLARFDEMVRADERWACAKVCYDAKNHPTITPITLGNRIVERGECRACKGRGYTDEGDPEVGSALFDCDNCGGTGRARGKQEKV